MSHRRIRLAFSVMLLSTACGSGPDADSMTPADDEARLSVEEPRILRIADGNLGADPVATARRAAGRHAVEYGLSKRALDAAQVAAVDVLAGGGTRVSLRQRLEGVEIWGSKLDIVLDVHGRAIALAGRLDPRQPAAAAVQKLSRPGAAAEAIVAAYEQWTGERLELARVRPGVGGTDDYRRFALDLAPGVAAGGIFVDPAVRVKPVWFSDGSALLAGHYLELLGRDESDGAARGQAFVISAQDGTTLANVDLVDDAAYRYKVWADPVTGQPHPNPWGPGVLPHPTGVPDGTVFATIDPVVIETEGSPAWLPDGASGTVGNNVEALTSRLGTTRVPAPLTDERAFEHLGHDGRDGAESDPAQAFTGVTSAFYMTNWMHDLLYAHGFDEAAGNAQRDNFDRGGVGGDPVVVTVASIYNNASMSTPADGASPRMNLYLFDTWAQLVADVGGTPRRYVAVPPYYDHDVGGFERRGPLVVSAGSECLPTGTDLAGKVLLHRLASASSSCRLEAVTARAASLGAIAVLLAVDNPSFPDAVSRRDGYGATLPSLSISSRTASELVAALAAGPVEVRLVRPLRDSAVDATIVGHEWTHYMFRRLVAGGAGDISTSQAGALNEGTADFVALVALARADDASAPGNEQYQGAYAQGAYSLGGASEDDHGYFGTRRFPYTTDLTRNPLTFKHVEHGVELPAGPVQSRNDAGNAEVHNAGEVWATVLWDCFVALAQAHGLDEGRQRMLGYTVAALKLVPATPTFLDARDAFLVAAAAADPGDEERFWKAFARRGFGEDARAPTRTSYGNRGLVESFEHPYQTKILDARVVEGASSCDHDGIVDAGELGELVLRIRRAPGVTDVATTVSGPAEVSFPAGVSFPAPVGDARVFELRIPFALIEAPASGPLLLNVAVEGADRRHERTVATAVHQDRLFGTVDDVEASASAWDVSGATGEGWKRVSTVDTTVWRLATKDSRTHASLVSPPMVDDGSGQLRLSFDHRMRVYSSDGGVLEASVDGGATWVDIGEHAVPGYGGVIWGPTYPDEGRRGFTGENDSYPRFDRVVVDLGDAFRNRTVRFRFRLAARDYYNLDHVLWDIDNIAVSGVQGAPFARLVDNARTCALADAGPDKTVNSGNQVLLSGRGSHAYPGETLTYTWSQVDGPPVTLSPDGLGRMLFAAPSVDADTDLRFRLLVHSDVRAADATDEMVVHVRSRIVVDLGPDRRVLSGSEVTLDASNTRGSAGDVLVYEWRQSSFGTQVVLEGQGTPVVRFRAPEVTTTTSLFFSLSVTAPARGAYDYDSFYVRVVPPLVAAPNASAAIIGAGSQVSFYPGLNRSGEGVEQVWTQTSGPTAEHSQTSYSLDVIAPSTPVHTELRFRLDATAAETSEAAHGEVSVLVAAANAGEERAATSGDLVALGAAQPEGLIPGLVYTWNQTGGPAVTLEAGDGPTPRFIAPVVDAPTELAFELSVSLPERGTLAWDAVLVNLGPAAPDAGPGQSDAGPPAPGIDAGEPDPVDQEGGCGCRVASHSADGSSTGAIALLIAGLLVLLGRRLSAPRRR